MPIVDYKHVAEKAKSTLYSKPISKINFKYLDKFLDAYDVSPARQALFCRHIEFLLLKTDDIKRDMYDRDKINKIFKELRAETKPSYYLTIINVSLRFVTWLNDGEKPKGFKDIKNSHKKQKRDLKPEDMVTWEDGLKMADVTNSTQLKAIILSQLDGGFRPSEFIDLKFGDIKREGKFLIAHVSHGKTGSRNVILFRCVPYLSQWLSLHPTKQKDDPLWVLETPLHSRRILKQLRNGAKKKRVYKYPYGAVRMITKTLAKRSGIDKPVDFYNLRHSACTLSKKDNMPIDLASEKFGHSTEYYTKTYGRLSLKDKVKRIQGHYGMIEEEEKKGIDKPIECQFCHTINEPNKEYCMQCNSPLSLDIALRDKTEKDFKIEKLQSEIQEMQKVIKLNSIASKDELKKMMKEMMKEVIKSPPQLT